MTANAMPADRQKCLAAGMVDFVAKPIEPDELWEALLRWIKPKYPAQRPPRNAETDPQFEAARHIRGLDTVNGLRRVLGKKELYVSMLRKFAAGQRHVAAEIAAALDAGDWGTAERLTHTLKGLAGNIGANGLKAETERLESAISQRRARIHVDALLESVARMLSVLISEVVAWLPSEAIGEAATAVDRPRLSRVCRQLAALLAESDAEAGYVLDAESALLKTAFGGSYRTLENAVRAFEYEAGLTALRASADAAGIAI
jgi:two-component system sensor histidine kinase/response regulator